MPAAIYAEGNEVTNEEIARVTTNGPDAFMGDYRICQHWQLHIGKMYIADTSSTHYGELFERIAKAWNEAGELRALLATARHALVSARAYFTDENGEPCGVAVGDAADVVAAINVELSRIGVTEE